MRSTLLTALTLGTYMASAITAQQSLCRPQYNTNLMDNEYAAVALGDELVAYETQLLTTYGAYAHETMSQTETHKFVYNATNQTVDYTWVLSAGAELCTGLSITSSALAWNQTNYALQYGTCQDQCIHNVTSSWLSIGALSCNQSGASDTPHALSPQFFADAFYNDPAGESGSVSVGQIGGDIPVVTPGYFDVHVPITLDRCVNNTCRPMCLQFNETSCEWTNNNIQTIYTDGACTVTCQLYDFTGQGITSGGALFQVNNLVNLTAPSGYVAPPPGTTTTTPSGATGTPTSNTSVPTDSTQIVISLVGTIINQSLCTVDIELFKATFITDLTSSCGCPASQFMITNVVYNELIQSVDVYLAVIDILLESKTLNALHSLARKSLATATTGGQSTQSIIDGLYYDSQSNTGSTTYLKYADFKSIKQLCTTGGYAGYYTTSCLVGNLPTTSQPALNSSNATVTSNSQPSWVYTVIGILAGLLVLCLAGLIVLLFKRRKQHAELAQQQQQKALDMHDVESGNYNHAIPIGGSQHVLYQDGEVAHTPTTTTRQYVEDEHAVEAQQTPQVVQQ